jgi:hypothetical protein
MVEKGVPTYILQETAAWTYDLKMGSCWRILPGSVHQILCLPHPEQKPHPVVEGQIGQELICREGRLVDGRHDQQGSRPADFSSWSEQADIWPLGVDYRWMHE